MLGTARFITLEAAKKMVAAGEAEARKNGWNVAIAIVDVSGGLILFHKLDETQAGSIAVAQGKARAAALFKRPSKAMEDAIAGGKLAFVTIEGIVPMQGGLPVIVEDKVIGAVGVSGVTSAQDEQVAQAAIGGLNV
jgi:glc operon protein GlcG